MAHSLDPKTILIPSGSADTLVAQIIDAVCTLTGWTKKDGYIYPDASDGIRILVQPYSTNAQIYTYFRETKMIGGSAFGVYTSSDIIVSAQQSTGETVTALQIYNPAQTTVPFTALYVLNENGVPSIFSGGDFSSSTFALGTSALEEKISIPVTFTVGNQHRYTLSKMPDFVYDAVFPELFIAFSVPRIVRVGESVSFDGNIYRCIHSPTSSALTSGRVFAFPVSD